MSDNEQTIRQPEIRQSAAGGSANRLPVNHQPARAERRERVIDSFLDYLRVEKGLAPLTVESYESDLTQFAGVLKRRALVDARREDVRGFLSQLFANGVKDRSVARKLSALRHFYKYLLLDRMIKQDPTIEIDSPKQWKVLPKSLAKAEIDSMLETAGRADDTKLSAALA